MNFDSRLPELLLRWEQLRAHGQEPIPEELCRDCPELVEELCKAVRVLQTINTLYGTPKEGVGTPAAPLASMDRRAFGDYLVLRELGRGGMGVVYQAYDRKRQELVALKTLKGIDPSALYRLKQEFRALAEVTHPNLVGLYELVATEEQCYFTMEMVEGVNFLAYLRAGAGVTVSQTVEFVLPPQTDPEASNAGPELQYSSSLLRYDRLRDTLRQLAAGIAALHALGKIHRDIKPSNVLVTHEGRVVLLDLGLAADLDWKGEHQSTEQHVTGTIAYMAPEQAASLTLSVACDCYSIGVMLYEALTGQLPFKGTPFQVLMDKQKHVPPAPSELVPEIPPDLNDLCVALLNRSPEARPSAQDILQILGGSFAGAESRSAQTEKTSFVGREQQLTQLMDAFTATRKGHVAVVRMQGRSGAGKSMLAQHFLDQLNKQGEVVVLAGKCYERESVPYKALDTLIDALSRYLRHLPAHEAQALLPREVNLLTRVFPVLGRVAAVAEAPGRTQEIVDPQELRRRAFGALRELLARLGDRKPLVLFIDDLQWGDLDGVTQLIELFRPPDPPVLLLLACYRSEDAQTSPCLRLLQKAVERAEFTLDHRQVDIEPLSFEEARTLARLLFGRNDPTSLSQAETIARESGGNPFFVHVLVQCLAADAGLVEHSPQGSLVLDEVLWKRIQALPNEAQRLLEVIAASGQPLKVAEACHAATPIKDEHGTLGALRSSRLIRSTGVADLEEVETYHDRIRETILSHLSADAVKAHHGSIAQVLEKAVPADFKAKLTFARGVEPASGDDATLEPRKQESKRIFDLAYHFDAAGESSRAFPYALAMAEQARAQYALEIAEQLYRIAERGAEKADQATRYQVAKSLGEVLMLRGRYPDAEPRFKSAYALTTNTVERAQMEANLAELAFKCGDMKTATEATERALRMLGNRVPHWSATFLFCLLWEVVVQALHTLLPRWFLARRTLDGAEKQLLTVRLNNRLAYCYWFGKGKIPCLWTHLRGMNLAELYSSTLELAQAYSVHAPVMSLVPYFSRGIAYAQKAFDIYKSLGDLLGQAQSQNFLGLVLYAASRYEEALEKCRAAERLLERTGDLWEVNIVRYHASNCNYRLGNLSDAVAESRRIHQSGLELGDIQATGICLDVWAPASGGKVPMEVLQTELQRQRADIQVTVQVMFAEGVRLLMLNRPEEAAAVFEKAHQRAENAGLFSAWTVPHRSWLATALRRQAEKCDPTDRLPLLKRAKKVARRALRVARTFQNDLPHALRESGLIAAMQGNTRQARAYLDESLEVADRQKARFEHAQTLLARGRVGLKAGWPGAQEEIDAAQQALHSLGADFVLQVPSAAS
jgi:serine/threonine protein kinase/tetratricopeptide (TPR) repeat protein